MTSLSGIPEFISKPMCFIPPEKKGKVRAMCVGGALGCIAGDAAANHELITPEQLHETTIKIPNLADRDHDLDTHCPTSGVFIGLGALLALLWQNTSQIFDDPKPCSDSNTESIN